MWLEAFFLQTMTEKNINDQVKEALLQDAIQFSMDIYPRTRMERWLQKKGWKPKQKTYYIRPITYGNLQRITSLFSRIQIDAGNSGLAEIYKIMEHHSGTVAKIIATAITNDRKEPSDKLVRDLQHNLSAKDGAALMSIIIRQMDISGFFRTIVLMRGINLSEQTESSKTGPQVPGNLSEQL